MQRVIFCLAAAVMLATISAAPAAAQTVAPEFANSPLTLEQEQVITHIRNSDRYLYLNARGTIPKHLPDWTQADYERFKRRYERLRLYRLRLLREGAGEAKLPEDIAATETAIFFESMFQSTGGGGDGSDGGEGGED